MLKLERYPDTLINPASDVQTSIADSETWTFGSTLPFRLRRDAWNAPPVVVASRSASSQGSDRLPSRLIGAN